MKAALCFSMLVVALSGCASQNWFEAMKASARTQCQRNPDQEAARRCNEEVDRRKYEQYEQDRPK